MFKRMLTVILVSCLLPVMAYAAWSLNTRNYTTGGSIQVGSAPPQTSTTSVFKSYTTSKPVTIKVTPKSGYIISQVNFNGVIITNPVETSFLVQGPTSQKFFAWYAAFSTSISLTVSVDGNYGGGRSPESVPLVYGTALTTPVVVTFTPASSSYRLSTISGIPSSASQNPAAPLSGQTVSVTFPVGFASTTNINLVGKFVYTDPVANAGAAQVAYLGKNVLLDGTESQPGDTGISSYSWVQVSGPAVTILNANMAQAHFNAAAEGVYTFSLTVMPGGSTATTSVNTTADVVGLVRTQCHDCHYSINHTLAIGAFNKWSGTKHASYAVVCANCHVGADTGGHPGLLRSGSVSETTFNYTESAGSGNFCVTCHSPTIPTEFAASKHFIRAGSASCSFCHVGGVHNPNAACVDCHNPGNSYGLLWPPTGLEFHNVYTGTNRCTECHNQHSVVASGCDGCHGAPPATASHLKHFGGTVSQAGYGDLRIAQDFTANSTSYIIGCGNCHPMDMTKHRNGVVDIELYNQQAAAGSLKALNPASAEYVTGPQVITDNKGIPYTEGTCSNVYCHSYNDWTTTAAIPPDDPNWQDKVVVTRKYKSATWGSAALGCSGCHGNPTQTSYPTNDGGAGDSHAWIDSWGYGNLHTFNMAADPVSCSYCHNDTVKQKNTFTRNNMDVTVLGDVPINDFSKHVNGSNDVAFDKQKPFIYYSSSQSEKVSMSLATATYAPATKTCSNVSCHIQETTVKWGTPYRIYYDACDKCHGYGGY